MNKQLLFDIEQRPANMVFAIARLTEVIEHLYYYQLLCIFSADGFQMPCHRKYPNRYLQAYPNPFHRRNFTKKLSKNLNYSNFILTKSNNKQ